MVIKHLATRAAVFAVPHVVANVHLAMFAEFSGHFGGQQHAFLYGDIRANHLKITYQTQYT